MRLYPGIKRTFDVAAAAMLLALTSPLVLAIATAIRVTMGPPVLFRQKRPGREERIFTCLKFTTMTNARDAEGNLLEDRLRTTPLGSWLRRTSLDELPQLWNILRGDQSFVGPRPLLIDYLPYYTPEERRRHSVRPGLTGWAQIHGRNRLSFAERLSLDIWYVDHMSWWLDARILWRTFWIVLTQHGYAHDARSLQAERAGIDDACPRA